MEYEKEKYKIGRWKNPLVLHWIINPGVMFNELILGQRIPKITLIEKNSSLSLSEKSYIPCPHCGTLHPALKWSHNNKTAFGNWFGLYCDHCGQIIPCLTNITSYIILGLTFPFWYFFKNKWKEKWLEQQKIKFSKPIDISPPDIKWWKMGLGWGITMYICMAIVFPLISGEDITHTKLLKAIPIWLVAGLFLDCL